MDLDEALKWADTWAKTSDGDGDSEALAVLAAEVRALITLAEDAHEAWKNDRDSKVGKLLLSMIDTVHRKSYRPDLTPNA